MSRRRKPIMSSKKIYDNCIILAPDGKQLCCCGKKRLTWYLERSLADLVSEDPFTIKLHFEPKGRANVAESSTVKENKCAVCGSEEKITRHHIIPWCFRHYMPPEWKRSAALFHDIVVVCTGCHNRYESLAQELKNDLAKKHNILIHGSNVTHDGRRESVKRKANSLLHWRDRMSPENIALALSVLKSYFNKEEITQEDLLEAIKVRPLQKNKDFKPFGQYVIEHTDNLGEFVLMWRRHFLDAMKPKFMPDYWIVDRLPHEA